MSFKIFIFPFSGFSSRSFQSCPKSLNAPLYIVPIDRKFIVVSKGFSQNLVPSWLHKNTYMGPVDAFTLGYQWPQTALESNSEPVRRKLWWQKFARSYQGDLTDLRYIAWHMPCMSDFFFQYLWWTATRLITINQAKKYRKRKLTWDYCDDYLRHLSYCRYTALACFSQKGCRFLTWKLTCLLVM